MDTLLVTLLAIAATTTGAMALMLLSRLFGDRCWRCRGQSLGGRSKRRALRVCAIRVCRRCGAHNLKLLSH